MELIRAILVRTPLPSWIVTMLGLGALSVCLLSVLIYKVVKLEREIQEERDKEEKE